MPGKELKDVESVARHHGMNDHQRRGFSEYLHDCKRLNDKGTKNARGDFTWQELNEKAEEFLNS